MRLVRAAVVIAMVACGSIAVAVVTGGGPTTASAASAPTATTGSASNVGPSGATVSATVNPNGAATSYHFEYGTTTGYGSNTAATSAGSGTADMSVSANLTGLSPGTVYHYRVVADNSAGKTPGADKTFTTTAPPSVTTGGSFNLGRSSASLNGTVNPRGHSTSYFFRYGPTTAYGFQTSPASAGSGNGNVGVHARIFGLSPNTTYHYQLVASSSEGTSTGADQTLTTTTSSQARVLGREGFVSPGRVVGVELGCFHGASACTGHLTMTHNGTVIGQRNYSIAPDSGGFQNMVLSRAGQGMLRANHVFHLLPVTVTATGTNGQRLSFVIHLARWVWH